MREEDYYPPGAFRDPNAPYNQVEPDEKEVDVTVSITLSKNTTVWVDNYIEEEWEDSEIDDEGNIYRTGGVDCDYSNCDFNKAYSEQQNSIPQLLKKLEEYLKADLEKPENIHNSKLKNMLEECQNWVVDEQEVVLDK